MKLRVRAWATGTGAAGIALLFVRLLQAPPDGVQRSELAQFLGRFHPLAVHLPIALLVLVPLLECASLFRNKLHLRQAAGFVLGLGTAAAITSAWLGWLLAWSGGYEGSLVIRHMWGGVFLATACLVCCALYVWRRGAYAIALLATLGLLVWTSDLGGKLTHGETFLTEHSPETLRGWLGGKPTTSVDANSFYVIRVQPIFEQKCVLCHNAGKYKGKLRLDSYENAMRGGKDGPVIRPGDPGTSELIHRVTLARESKDFMPAEGKPALTAAEIKVLEIWIRAGATPQIADSAIDGLEPAADHTQVPFALTEDYRPQRSTIAALESKLGVLLVPRSQSPTDGLILRTASAPAHCTDTTLAQLAPVASLIVDAELARTSVTDKGIATIAGFPNLKFLDLSNTGVTSAGVKDLVKLPKLESLNLSGTKVSETGLSALRTQPTLKHIYSFGSQ
jgi:uncharacterized membrane protein